MILFKGTDKPDNDDVDPEVATEVYVAEDPDSEETDEGDPDAEDPDAEDPDTEVPLIEDPNAGNTDQRETDAGDHFELNESPEEGIDENIEDELAGGPGPRPDQDTDDDENKETADEAHEEFEGESSEDLKPVDDDMGHDYEDFIPDEGVAEQLPEDLNTVDEESANANEEDEELDFGEYEDLNPLAGELETDEDLKNSDKNFSEELTEDGSHEELSEDSETAEEDPKITDEIVKTPHKDLKTSNEDVAGESREVIDDTSSNANTEDKEVLDDEYYESHEEPEDNKITPSSESDGGNSRPNLKAGNRDLQTSDEYYAEDPEYPEGANDDNDHTLDDADEKEFAEDFAEDTDDASTDDTNAGDNAGDNVEDDDVTTGEYYDVSHEDDKITGRSRENGPPKSGNRDLQISDNDFAEDPENPEGDNHDHSHEETKDEYSENNDENYEDSEGEVPESNDENYDDNHEDSDEYEEYSEHDIDDEKG